MSQSFVSEIKSLESEIKRLISGDESFATIVETLDFARQEV